MVISTSLLARIQGGVDLRNPTKTINEFSDKLARVTGKSVNNPLSNPEFSNRAFIEAAEARGDPLLSMDWLAVIIDRSNPKAIEWSYIQAVQTPSIQIEPRSVFRAGKMAHYAGILSVENLSISMYTDTQARALKLVSSWVGSIYDNNSGNYKLPKDYMKDVYVYLLDSTYSTVCVMKFFKCFPTSWTSYSLDTSQTSPIVTTFDLSVETFSIGGPEETSSQISALSRST